MGAGTLRSILADKRGEAAEWSGNASTKHGNAREPHIAAWVEGQSRRGRFGSGALISSKGLFARPDNPRHLATPDGMSEDWEFFHELVEIKTTVEDWKSIPRSYLRQVWWQQYVLGAERTLVVWEQRDGDFRPMDLEPRWQWVKRDQAEIESLVESANKLLVYMDSEAPLPPRDIDSRITKFLKLRARRDALQEQMDEIELYLRNRAQGKPMTVLGTAGDVSISASSTSLRFSAPALREDHPDLYESYLKESPVKGRFTITAAKAESQQQESAAA